MLFTMIAFIDEGRKYCQIVCSILVRNVQYCFSQ